MLGTLLALIFLSVSLTAQTADPLYLKHVNDAITAMEAGFYDKALELLDSAEAVTPGTLDVPYERALVFYMKKDYGEAISILTELTKRTDATDQCYSMLGNALDLSEESDDAIRMYEEGIKKFPNSGPLYLERGIMAMKADDYDGAVKWFEDGVEHAPYHPSNYYWLSKIYLNSLEYRTWGLLYAEMFCLLEQKTKRTREIGKLLADSWNKVVHVSASSDSIYYEFGSNEMKVDDKFLASMNSDNPVLPFDWLAYRPTMAIAFALSGDSVLLNNKNWRGVTDTVLFQVRSVFIEQWTSRGFDTVYNVPLFALHKELKESNNLFNYHRWLLSRGDPEPFTEWCDKNRDACTGLFSNIRKSVPDLKKEPRFCRNTIE